MVYLQGRHVLVTGASSGIGRQTAVTLSQCGARLALGGRREEELKATMQQLDGTDHAYYLADLKDTDSIAALVQRIVTERGPMDGLASCAGVSTNRPLNMYTYEKLHDVMLINFYAYFELVRVLSKKGHFNPGASFVSVSSTAAVKGSPAQTAYAASKAAMDAAMRCMAKELSGKGIRCNSVMPSMIRTEMYEKYSARSGSVGNNDLMIAERQYLGIGEPVDVANAIAFLLSEDSKFITGIQLPVDGGYTSC